MTRKALRIQSLEMQGLAAANRANYLLDLAKLMTAGRSEREAEREILAEHGCGDTWDKLQAHKRSVHQPCHKPTGE